jgi:hypothetical protein
MVSQSQSSDYRSTKDQPYAPFVGHILLPKLHFFGVRSLILRHYNVDQALTDQMLSDL